MRSAIGKHSEGLGMLTCLGICGMAAGMVGMDAGIAVGTPLIIPYPIP